MTPSLLRISLSRRRSEFASNMFSRLGFVLVFLSSCHYLATATNQCGIRPGGRIISGSQALPHSWPWMVQIKYQDRHHCGGTLVSPQWLVTAAHCINHVNNPSSYPELEIVLGEHTRSRLEGNEQKFTVKRIVMHPNYDKPSIVNNDIALIKLDRPAFLNKHVSLACLPQQNLEIAAGKICYATGWGLTIPGDWDSQADILQQTKLPIVSSNECKQNYKDISIPITSSMLCTGHDLTSTISTCNTDSGGPIVCKNSLNGKWYLQGVVSFGAGGCRPGYYSVNAKVSKFTTWINSYIH